MVTHITEEIPRSVWYGWGDPARAQAAGRRRPRLPAQHAEALRRGADPPAGGLLRRPRGREPARRRGAGRTPGHQRSRTRLHRGRRTHPALGRQKHPGPDAPARRRRPGAPRTRWSSPAAREEVREILALCVRRGIAVVAFGGGTSVVGGVDPVRGGFAGVITLDMRRMDKLLHLDPVSRTATLRGRDAGPRDRGRAAGPRLHARPLPAEPPGGNARRLRGHPLRRPGLHRLRPAGRPGQVRPPGNPRRARSSSAPPPRAAPPARSCSTSSWEARAPSGSSPPPR